MLNCTFLYQYLRVESNLFDVFIIKLCLMLQKVARLDTLFPLKPSELSSVCVCGVVSRGGHKSFYPLKLQPFIFELFVLLSVTKSALHHVISQYLKPPSAFLWPIMLSDHKQANGNAGFER